MSAVLKAISAHAARTPDAPALVCGDERYSYGALKIIVEDAARALAEILGPTPGCVALCLENCAAWVILDLALVRLGRTTLPVPSFFTPAQVAHAMRDAGAGWIIEQEGDGATFNVGGASLTIETLREPNAAAPTGAAKITYTSGTTANPKGVRLSQTQMEAVALSIVGAFGADYAGVHVAVLPLSILLENVAGLYSVAIAGGCYHAEKPGALGLSDPFRPDFVKMGRALVEIGATSLIIVPEILRGMLMARAFGVMTWPAFRLIAVGGAKVAPDIVSAARAVGLPVFEGYGLSECASVVAVNTPSHDRIGSVGRPLAHLRVSLASDGEIIVEPACERAAANAWGPVRTGDIGCFDEDGFLYVTGRKSNVIITAFARNISPEWVESELLSQPEIRHALVFGESRSNLAALIVPTMPHLTREQISGAITRTNQRLPAYAHVTHFHLVPPFTVADGQLTPNGRLKRSAIHTSHRSMIDAEG